MINIYDQVRVNRRNTWLILFVFILFFLFLGFGFDYFYGPGLGFGMPVFTITALIVSLLSSYAGYNYGDKLVLSSTHARELDMRDPKQEQWKNVVEEMSIAAGITVPKMFIIDDADPNAFATGKGPGHASIAVTKGLLDTLDRDELQAVAAHEMSHIKNYDIRLMLIIAVLVGSLSLLADWTSRGMIFGRRRDDNSDNKSEGALALIIFMIWVLAAILAPLFSQLMAMCVSRKREYLADASGAELTRNPIALANALEKIDSHSAPTRSINKGTAHLCIADPSGRPVNSKEGMWADLLATHPPMNKRIEALKQMAYTK